MVYVTQQSTIMVYQRKRYYSWLEKKILLRLKNSQTGEKISSMRETFSQEKQLCNRRKSRQKSSLLG